MGSTAKGLLSGFICRLCSKMNRYVILIYGEQGIRMGLADKINLYLPITVTRNDPLPKTVCPNCVDRLEKHAQMIQMIASAENKFNSSKEMSPSISGTSSWTSATEECDSDTENDEESEYVHSLENTTGEDDSES